MDLIINDLSCFGYETRKEWQILPGRGCYLLAVNKSANVTTTEVDYRRTNGPPRQV